MPRGCFRRRCPSAVPALSFDTAGLSDGEIMARLGQLPGEDIPSFLNRTKGLVVLMATVMQVREEERRLFCTPLPEAGSPAQRGRLLSACRRDH